MDEEHLDMLLDFSEIQNIPLRGMCLMAGIKLEDLSEDFLHKVQRLYSLEKNPLTNSLIATRNLTAISEFVHYEKMLHEFGIDPLTGLYIRRKFNEDLESKVIKLKSFGHRDSDRSNRREYSDEVIDDSEDRRQTWIGGRRDADPQPLVLAMLDLDYFKQVNDNLGHFAGDEVLKHAGHLIKELQGDNTMSSRYGGEELAIRFSTDLDNATDVCEDIRSTVEQRLKGWTYETDEGLRTPTVSIGIFDATQMPKEDLSVESVIKGSDAALYTAKNNGRNQVQVNN